MCTAWVTGWGLHIHEEPFFRLNGPDSMRLAPGVVITVEPGLYYPERKMGVRLEDTLYARPDGVFEVLAIIRWIWCCR